MIWHRAWSRVSAGIAGRIVPAALSPGMEVHLGQFVHSAGPDQAEGWGGRRSERLWQAMRAERERLGIDAPAAHGARGAVDGEIRRVRR